MEPKQTSDTRQTRGRLNRKRGNFYLGLGFTLVAGLSIVVALGVFGFAGFGWSLGIFSASTAWAMTAAAITLVAAVSFVTLVSMRRTLTLLSEHETALVDQAARHADLASKVQSQWHDEQVVRDRRQDEATDALSVRQDADDVARDEAADALWARQDSNFVIARPERNHARKAGVDADPFEGGQIHPVIDVEGIGEHYSKLLVDLGVKDTKQLWNADTAYLADALEIRPGAVDGWQCMAELMAITGIGKQYAEVLVRADVMSIDELCSEDPQPLLDRLQALAKRQGNRIQGNTIGIKTVKSWISAAQAHRGLEPALANGA